MLAEAVIMMAYDFSAMSITELRRETLCRVVDVWDIKIRALIRCLIAFVSFAVPILVATLFTMDDRIVFGVAGVVSAGPVVWWILALCDCVRYTKEMNARTRELNKRTRGMFDGRM